jgi:hypothetical protein
MKTKLTKKFANKNSIQVLFDCYRFSTRVEYRLVFNFLIREIEKEEENFDLFCGKK